LTTSVPAPFIETVALAPTALSIAPAKSISKTSTFTLTKHWRSVPLFAWLRWASYDTKRNVYLITTCNSRMIRNLSYLGDCLHHIYESKGAQMIPTLEPLLSNSPSTFFVCTPSVSLFSH
jgi:hypothetical protein